MRDLFLNYQRYQGSNISYIGARIISVYRGSNYQRISGLEYLVYQGSNQTVIYTDCNRIKGSYD